MRNENYPSANEAEWLIADSRILGPDDRKILDGLLSSDQFTKTFDREGIVVARRVRPTPPTVPAGSTP